MPRKISPITRERIEDIRTQMKYQTPEQRAADEEFLRRTKARRMKAQTQENSEGSTEQS